MGMGTTTFWQIWWVSQIGGVFSYLIVFLITIFIFTELCTLFLIHFLGKKKYQTLLLCSPCRVFPLETTGLSAEYLQVCWGFVVLWPWLDDRCRPKSFYHSPLGAKWNLTVVALGTELNAKISLRILPLEQGGAAWGQGSIGQWQDHLPGASLTGGWKISLPGEIREEVRDRNKAFPQQSSYPLLPRCVHPWRRCPAEDGLLLAAWAGAPLCPCGLSPVQPLDLFFQHRAASGRQHVSPGVIKL